MAEDGTLELRTSLRWLDKGWRPPPSRRQNLTDKVVGRLTGLGFLPVAAAFTAVHAIVGGVVATWIAGKNGVQRRLDVNSRGSLSRVHRRWNRLSPTTRGILEGVGSGLLLGGTLAGGWIFIGVGSPVVGCVLETDDHRFYNAALYLHNGRVHHVHRKVYLPTYGLFDEARYFAQGDRFRPFTAPMRTASHGREWRAGILICEDMWHPTAPALLARQDVDVLLCTSSSPARGVGSGTGLGTARSYDAMTRTYAQLLTSYLIYCNRVGYEDGIAFWGGSRIVAPDGTVVAGPAGRDEEIITARLDHAAIRRARIANPLLRDERHDVNDAETDRLRRRRARD